MVERRKSNWPKRLSSFWYLSVLLPLMLQVIEKRNLKISMTFLFQDTLTIKSLNNVLSWALQYVQERTTNRNWWSQEMKKRLIKTFVKIHLNVFYIYWSIQSSVVNVKNTIWNKMRFKWSVIMHGTYFNAF